MLTAGVETWRRLLLPPDSPDLPALPNHPDAEKLLGLHLVVYPGEMEDDLWMWVHLMGRVRSRNSQLQSSYIAAHTGVSVLWL